MTQSTQRVRVTLRVRVTQRVRVSVSLCRHGFFTSAKFYSINVIVNYFTVKTNLNLSLGNVNVPSSQTNDAYLSSYLL